MTSKAFAAGVLVAIVAAMALASKLDADEAQRSHTRYCENVVLWEAQARQGISPYDRHGHPDYDGIAEQHCPGMKPAR